MFHSTAQTIERQPARSAGALRPIGETALELNVEPHVLRFWERKFSQIRPVKRSNGRRYYRAEDIDLLRRIRSLLYSEGYTIKGVQRLLDSESDQPAARQEIKTLPGTRLIDAEAGRPLPPPAAIEGGRNDVASTLKELQDALALLRQTLLAS
jgi:DNA-binding transcriptional MerR regulator